MTDVLKAGGEAIRVLVADSNQTQSHLLIIALRRQREFRVTSCSADLAECFKSLASAPADIVLIADDAQDDTLQVEVLRGLHNAHPKTGLILLGDRYDRDQVVRAMRMGARGLFCRLNSSFRALCRCISVVHQGQFWLDAEQISYVIDAITTPQSTRLINWNGKCLLSPREEQVVSLVARALGNRDIAQQLNIKENTVKKSLLRIYDKLGVSNRVELVLYALAQRSPERTSPALPKRVFHNIGLEQDAFCGSTDFPADWSDDLAS